MAAKTVEEWMAWINSVEEDELLAKLQAMNTFQFVDQVQELGLGPDSIEQLFTAMCRRVENAGLALPTEGEYMDLSAYMRQEALLSL